MKNVVSRAIVIAIMGWVVGADASSARFEETAPSDTHGQLQQAVDFAQQEDFESALRLTTEVIDQDPANSVAYMVRGTTHRKSGQYMEAIADLDRAIELSPQISEAYAQRAFARQQGRLPDSSKQILADLQQAIKLKPTNALAHLLRGNQLADLNEHEAAVASYDRALRLNPRSYTAMANRAASYLHLGRVEDARRDLQGALKLDPLPVDRARIESLIGALKSRGK